MSKFAHLHLHTQYSLLDGANKLPEILKQAYALGQPAIAMTDHGNMHGAVEFYRAAKEIGIKAIIGCELYVSAGSRFDKRPKAQGGAGTHHLTVLAKDKQGYQNLCRLVTLAYREGFYHKPRVDHELLEQYSEGLIVLSGCLASELNSFVEVDDLKRARELLEFYALHFKDRFFLEIQPHAIKEQQKLNQGCFLLAQDMGLPIVASNDCHYPTVDDHYAQEVLMCVSTGKLISDPTRIQHIGLSLHLKSYTEMKDQLAEFKRAEEALSNTVLIAEQCKLEFDFKTHYMPRYQAEEGKTLTEMMAEKARAGLQRRITEIKVRAQNWSSSDAKSYQDRLEEEIALIDKMGFSGYFLVVSDFIVWAKENSIPVGPGRGSVAGSLVAFAMRITEVDPIPHKLLFERFLNPERVSLPDIDVDFCIYGRDRVIKYVVEKYGKDRVAQIVTFGSLKAKAAIKDVGRALGISYAETDRIAQLVPAPRQGFDYPLSEAIKMEKRLAEYAENEGQELISLALKLEGLTRHTSTHAAGVVIGDRPLIDLVPLMLDKDGNEVTQYEMGSVEKIGLVKFDFLGLKTLTVIHTALKIIKESRSVEIDLETLGLDDPKTYALLCAGNTTGVFQLESGGITEITKRLRPSCFNDLVAILALYRPGPLDAGMVDHYIDRKHGRQQVVYLHPLMRNILADTYGIIVYQEQIMQLARELAGYSLGDADLLRRAMGKKNPEEMAKQRDMFVNQAAARGLEKRLATQIFDQMETFARYGFNRSHSAAYAMISYQTAYLKAHYKVEFMAALMSHEMDDSDKTLKNLNECREQAIAVLPPDVNKSAAGFTTEQGKIRFGLEALKGVGSKAAQHIFELRNREGDFQDLEDFIARVDLHSINRKVIESLVKCGAFDFSGVSRREMSESIEQVLKAGQALQRDRDTNQIALFGGADGKPSIAKRRTRISEWPINQKLAFEREALGFYLTGHPLEKYIRELKRLGAKNTAQLRTERKQNQVRVGGVITALKLKNTKKGDRYATFVFEDWLGTLEAIVWPDVYKQLAHLMVADDPVLITAKLDVNEDRRVLIVDTIESLLALRDKKATIGVVELKSQDCQDKVMQDLADLLKRHPGVCPVRVKLEDAPLEIVLKTDSRAPVCVKPSEILCEEVEQLFGRPVLSFM